MHDGQFISPALSGLAVKGALQIGIDHNSRLTVRQPLEHHFKAFLLPVVFGKCTICEPGIQGALPNGYFCVLHLNGVLGNNVPDTPIVGGKLDNAALRTYYKGAVELEELGRNGHRPGLILQAVPRRIPGLYHLAILLCVEHNCVAHSEKLVHICIIIPTDLTGCGLRQAVKLDD